MKGREEQGRGNPSAIVTGKGAMKVPEDDVVHYAWYTIPLVKTVSPRLIFYRFSVCLFVLIPL